MSVKKISRSLKNCPVLIIGGGPVGIAFAHALKKHGIPLLGITSREKKKAAALARKLELKPTQDYLPLVSKARLILIAVRDHAIKEVAMKIVERGDVQPETFLAHTSGALTSSVLKTPKKNIFVFSLHPLQSFASHSENPQNLKGIPLIYEGDKKATGLAKELSRILGGKLIAIKPKAKVIYHAAASMASNFLVTLAHLSSKLNEKAGIPKLSALAILLPLMSTTVNNLKNLGLPKALTGPIQRGDYPTVQKHLSALKEVSANLATLYKLLSFETLTLAREKGLTNREAQKLESVLKKQL